MKKYYLHNGTESSGPFDIEELKAKNISTKTPVWFEGLEKWKTAGEIEELKSIFVVIPTPSIATATIPKIEKIEKIEEIEEIVEQRKILGLSKSSFLIACAVLIVAIGTIVFNTLQENRSRELELKNHKTEIENYQLELKQKAIEDEKIQAVIQEKIEAERIAREKKQKDSNRLSEIEQLLIEYQTNLDASEKKRNDTSSFKFLRTAAEKKEQMDLLQKDIDSFKIEMEQLKTESNQLKLELEKIK